MSNWLSAAEGFVSVGIPVVGLIYTYTTNRRSQYERVLALAAQVSTPPIADDRHVAGSVFEPFDPTSPGSVSLREHEIKAVFNVLWYFERTYAVYVSLRPLFGSRRITRVQALLLDTVASPVTIWMRYLTARWIDAAGEEIDASDEIVFIKRLADEQVRLREQRSRGWIRRAYGH